MGWGKQARQSWISARAKKAENTVWHKSGTEKHGFPFPCGASFLTRRRNARRNKKRVIANFEAGCAKEKLTPL